MDIRVSQKQQAVVVAVTGRIDNTSAPVFEQQLEDLVAQGTTYTMVNCHALEYVSSAGLRSMLRIDEKLRAEQGRLAFAALQERTQKIFEISGFSSIFQIFASEEAALAQP